MLSIKCCVDADYYLQSDQALQYFVREFGQGLWYGRGAKALGFDGRVKGDDLRNAFRGFDPLGRKSLIQRFPGRRRQPAWDLTFSVPKCVSALWSVLNAYDRHLIEKIVSQAAKRGLAYIDEEALFTRRKKGGVKVEHAKGVYALFLHGVSRALDPQLHVHTLAMNICFRKDSTSGAIRSRDLYLHKMAAGAIFRLELAHLLRERLGLSISQDGWSFKIDGIPESLLQEQSKRRKVIEAIAREEGWKSPRTLAELAQVTRDAKGEVNWTERFTDWKETAKRHGFTTASAEKLLNRGTGVVHGRRRDVQRDNKRKVLREGIIKSIASLAMSKAYFPERDIVASAAAHAVAANISADELIQSVKEGVKQFEHRVEVDQSVYQHYSTKENVAAEKELIERIKKGTQCRNHSVRDTVAAKAIAEVERRLSRTLGFKVTFTCDQRAAVEHILLKPGRDTVLQGHAGTGKTECLQAAHLAWKKSGYSVYGIAMTGKAALGLQKATGIESFTVELLLKMLRLQLSDSVRSEISAWTHAAKSIYYEGFRAGRWMRNPLKEAIRETAQNAKSIETGRTRLPRKSKPVRLTPKCVVVLDEAAMTPTQTLLALKRVFDENGVKFVLVGDHMQLPPIEAGGPFWSLAQRVLGYESLTTIVRQRHPWMREAVELLIKNRPVEALKLYSDNGCLSLAKSPAAAITELITDYSKLTSAEFSKAIATTATNAEARQINLGIQASRKVHRELGLDFQRLSNGERVYKNDRVMLTKNDYSLGVRNGQLGTVVGFNRTRGIVGPGVVTIRLDDHVQKKTGVFASKTVDIDLGKSANLQLGYAATTHKVQSITVASSFVLLGDSMLSKERVYTQLSRASHETRVYGTEAMYGDSLAVLAQQVGKVTAKDLAHDHKIYRRSEAACEQSNHSDDTQLLLQHANEDLTALNIESQRLSHLKRCQHDQTLNL